MFQINKIESKLYGIVGIRQPFNIDYAVIDSNNQISRSGYYVTDNSFVKVEYLKDTQDYNGISESDFNTYLERLQKSSIVNICGSVFNQENSLERNLLYTNTQNKINQENLENGFVGYKIKVSSDKNIAFEIKRVLLDFDTTGTFKLLLFNSSKLEPLFEEDITITSKTQEVVLNWKVDNSGDTYKGEYRLGYIKTATTPIPFKRDYRSSNEMSVFSNLSFDKVNVLGHSTETLYNLNDEVGLSKDIGINPDIFVYRDYTDFIINNESVFAKAIFLDFSISCLKEQINSLRKNNNQKISEKQVTRMLIEIEGTKGDSSLHIRGLRSFLTDELQELINELNKLRKSEYISVLTAYTVY